MPRRPCEASWCLAAKLTPHCRAAIFDSPLPSPKLPLRMPPPPQERAIFQNCPRGEGNCAAAERQKLSRDNFCLATLRCLSGPSGWFSRSHSRMAFSRQLAKSKRRQLADCVRIRATASTEASLAVHYKACALLSASTKPGRQKKTYISAGRRRIPKFPWEKRRRLFREAGKPGTGKSCFHNRALFKAIFEALKCL